MMTSLKRNCKFNTPKLKRSISLPLLTFYGLGTILGAGIYVLIGKVAGAAGLYAPIAFLVAATVAGFTAFSYAELSARYPKSSGESAYVLAAFKQNWLASIVGFLVIMTGIVSAATIANGFVGYLDIFLSIPDSIAKTLLIIFLTGLAIWGITESVGFATVVTLIELFGLVFVTFVAGDSLTTLPARLPELTPSLESEIWVGIMLGGFLAFYAFIGFEDMVNIAEEVKQPNKTMPRAIIIALLVATFLYLLIAFIAVLALPLEKLAASKAPLATLLASKGQQVQNIISLISLVAVVNGALVQIIMASRVLYGMSQQKLLHNIFSKVHAKTQTPVIATLCVGVVVLILALWFPLTTLAKATSFIVLSVFVVVNIALIRLKLSVEAASDCPNYPIWVPVIGLALCLGLLSFQSYQSFNTLY